MKHTTALFAAALAAPLLLASHMPGAKIAFAVAEGTSVTKTFETKMQLSLDDFNMKINGQDPPMAPEMEISADTTYEVVVTDEYLALMDGAPKKLKRTYDSLANNTTMAMEIDMMGETQSQEMPITATSELEGKTVIFTWNADESEYVASFPEEEGDEELLENLVEDMDLRVLLPDGEVAEGDEWDVDPAALSLALAPGGDLKLVPEEIQDVEMDLGPGGMDSYGDLNDWFNESMEGEVKATFTSMTKGEAGSLATIALVVKIENAVDMTELVQEGLEDAELPEGMGEMEMDIDHMDIEIEFEAEGTLVWNLTAGRAESFELAGDFTMVIDMGMQMVVPGAGEMDLEQTIEMSGNMTSTASFE